MPNLTFAIGGIWPFFGGKKGSIENKPMARAKRHYIPGQIWHLTHRCHKREFLLKFEKDRRRWMHWLFQAKKRYGLNILDYVCDEVTRYHRSWVETYLGNDKNIRDDKWTTSIAVGDKSFVEKIRSLMGVMAIGRKSNEAGDAYQLREPAAPYMAHFGGKRKDIGPENTYFWKDIS